MPYILEVQKIDIYGNPELNGKNEHIGYMNYIFQTKQQAANYYDKYNTHMRKLNEHKNWRSDCDPITHLQYVVREHGGEYLKIISFDKEYNIDHITAFIQEMIILTNDNKDKIGKGGLMTGFKQWFDQSQCSRKAPKSEELYEAMSKKFGSPNTKDGKWHGIKFIEQEIEEDN